MAAYLQHLLTQSLAFNLMVIMLVTFLESLALVGLPLTGTVIMTSISALIGSGKVDFYYAWGAASPAVCEGTGFPPLLGQVGR